MGLDTLDETKPYDTDPVSLGDDEIRLTRAATKQSFGMEHFLSGEHKFLFGDASTRPSAGHPGRLYVNSSNNIIEYDNGSAWVATGAVIVPGSIGPDQLAPGSVTNIKLGPNSVTTDKILNGSILGEDIAPGTINAGNLAPGIISGGYIAPGGVDTAQLADNSVTSAKIRDLSIQYNDIADGHVIRSKIQVNGCNGAVNMYTGPGGFATQSTGAWLNYGTGNYLQNVRGGWVHLIADTGLSVLSNASSSACWQRWLRNGQEIVAVATLVTLGQAAWIPLPGLQWIDTGPVVPTSFYMYQVYAGSGCTIYSPNGGYLAFFEVG